jgi:hypothetical protein
LRVMMSHFSGVVTMIWVSSISCLVRFTSPAQHSTAHHSTHQQFVAGQHSCSGSIARELSGGRLKWPVRCHDVVRVDAEACCASRFATQHTLSPHPHPMRWHLHKTLHNSEHVLCPPPPFRLHLLPCKMHWPFLPGNRTDTQPNTPTC